MSDAASVPPLEAATWPRPMEHHARLESTSDRLKVLARAGAPAWTAVLADVQTAGRGRHGRTWVSPAGNLHLSVLLRPSPTAGASLVPLMAGIAVAEALEGFGPRILLKWPNDLIVSGRKLGGLLAEASSSGAGLEWVVLGIGVNLSAALPPELATTAVSLVEAGGEMVTPTAAAAVILRSLRLWYDRSETSARTAILEAWRARALPWWGERVSVSSGGRTTIGRAIGLDADGGLVLELAEGKRLTVTSGEAALCRRAD